MSDREKEVEELANHINQIEYQSFTGEGLAKAILSWGYSLKQDGLVPLDKKTFRPYLIDAMSDFATQKETRLVQSKFPDLSDITKKHEEIICSKFGTPAPADKIHSCKCQRHPDSAFTAFRIDDGLLKCPRCGGIIIGRKEIPSVEEIARVAHGASPRMLFSTWDDMPDSIKKCWIKIGKAIHDKLKGL